MNQQKNMQCREDLKTVPNRFQQYIDNKYYVHASELLVEEVHKLFSEELFEIGGLKEIREDLLEKKNVRKEICN